MDPINISLPARGKLLHTVGVAIYRSSNSLARDTAWTRLFVPSLR